MYTTEQYSKCQAFTKNSPLIRGERERAPHLIVRQKFVCPSVRTAVCPVWLTEHARENNTCSLLCHASLPIICTCSNHQSQRRLRTREERPRMRMSDPTLATENELDGEDSSRERARLKRARDGSDKRTNQYVTVALSVRSSKLIFTSPVLNS